jgi:dimethylhistidine N-methyltransferase
MKMTKRRTPTVTDLSPKQSDFLTDVLNGLTSPQKTLDSKYFYDQTGSHLFEKITQLDEYYQTRTEMTILRESLPSIFQKIGENVDLIELGSGSSTKTRILLNENRFNRYIPVDISKTMLTNTVNVLHKIYPHLTIDGIVADYTRPFSLSKLGGNKKVVFYPGSTIGNFEPKEAAQFLKQLSQMLSPGDGLLIGVDLQKDPQFIENAYNDKQGITAAFNKNVLTRMNQELNTSFQIQHFDHYSFYSEEKARIEMHLVSNIHQYVEVNDQSIVFEKDESIHTENSYKYSISSFQNLCFKNGFKPIDVYVDHNEWFSIHYLEII